MTDRRRIAITVASALALGVTALGYELSVNYHVDSRIWGIGLLTSYGLAIVGVFFVDRWWALLPSLSVVGGLYLGELIHPYTDRWSSESIPLTPPFLVVLTALAVGFNAAFLSLGWLARIAWDEIRRRRSTQATTSWSGR